MTSFRLPRLTKMEKLLLMSAGGQKLGPNTSLCFANTWRIIRLVIQWTGLHEAERELEGGECPELERIYLPLVRMVSPGYRRPARHGKALFEGGGNWGETGHPERHPCHPQFNSCRLTEYGEQIAKALLAEQPDLAREAAAFLRKFNKEQRDRQAEFEATYGKDFYELDPVAQVRRMLSVHTPKRRKKKK